MPAQPLIKALAALCLMSFLALLVILRPDGGLTRARAQEPTATSTPTATPPPFDLWVLLSSHHPSPAISGQDKTWTLFVENSPVSSCWPNCPPSPPATLHVSLTGQADSEFTFDLGPMPSGYPRWIDVTSLVTEPAGGLVEMSASLTTDDPYSIHSVSASDSVVAETPTATPTWTPTATATPTPGPVGGIAELPPLAGSDAVASAEGSGWSAADYAALLVGVAAAGLVGAGLLVARSRRPG